MSEGHVGAVENLLEWRRQNVGTAGVPALVDVAPHLAAPCGLGNKGVTVKVAESLTERATDVGAAALANLGELERLRTPGRLRRQQRHRARALYARTKGNTGTAIWHEQRADALDRGYLPRALECEDPANARGVELACTSCGTCRWVPGRCGVVSACAKCATRKRGALFKRLSRGMGEAHRAAMGAWSRAGRPRGMRPDVELVTLTVGHSGVIKTDAKRLQSGWARLRARLYVQDGRALPFFRVYEITDGADELGHVHMHVAVIWPWRDLQALSAAWSDATDGVGFNVDVRGRKRAGRNPTKAASYVAGYVQKQGCSVRSLELRAAWLDHLADGARTYSQSRGLLAPKEPTCSCPECKGPETVLRVDRRLPRALRCVPARGPPTASIGA